MGIDLLQRIFHNLMTLPEGLIPEDQRRKMEVEQSEIPKTE